MLSKQTIPAWVCHPSPRPGKAPSRQACWHLIQEGQILTEGQNVSPTLGFNNHRAHSSHSKTFSGNSHYPLLTCLKVRQLLSWVQEEKNTFKPVTLYTKWCIGWLMNFSSFSIILHTVQIPPYGNGISCRLIIFAIMEKCIDDFYCRWLKGGELQQTCHWEYFQVYICKMVFVVEMG